MQNNAMQSNAMQCNLMQCNVMLLVGGLEHFLFSIIYGITLPIDFHIFKMVKTTNQVMLCYVCIYVYIYIAGIYTQTLLDI